MSNPTQPNATQPSQAAIEACRKTTTGWDDLLQALKQQRDSLQAKLSAVAQEDEILRYQLGEALLKLEYLQAEVEKLRKELNK